MGSLKKILERYHLEKWFQRDNFIILVLAGILLVVIALPTEDAKTQKEEADVENAAPLQELMGERTAVEAGAMPYDTLQQYAKYLEEKLEETLKDMRGVGKVKVMITLQTSEEQVVEKDEPISRNNTSEKDGDGGVRTIYQIDSGQETVYSKQGTDQTPYVTKTILPKISGVLIVAEGAGTGTVSKNITEIAEALFDLEVHKIKVVPME